MTQKELNYVEDAIKHESNISSIIEQSIEYLEDENLISFMEEQLENHKALHKKLVKLLEDKADE